MSKYVEEKRRYLRLNVPIEIEYILPGSDKIYKAVTKDISAIGLRFATQSELPKDTALELKLKLPNIPNPIHANGRIAWLKKLDSKEEPFSIGVEFIKIEEDNKNTFLKYLCDLIYG